MPARSLPQAQEKPWSLSMTPKTPPSPERSLCREPTERSALLEPPKFSPEVASEEDTHDRWKNEAIVILQGAVPLILALSFQYALTASSIFFVGHIGKAEPGAVSLANMTATITGYCIYQGFSTALDTLCPQAWGSGNKTLVGLYLQRMVVLLLLLTIPIGILWLNFTSIFLRLLPPVESRTAELAGLYLKIVLLGSPGYACFEAGKRFLQAQGLFTPILFVLLICASLNAFLGWLFVWKLNWGFVGAPIAVAIAMDLLPVFLALYVYFIRGSECWYPISRNVWSGWGPMIRLAIPSWLMVEAEFATWEIMTLASSYLGPNSLAAQSGLITVTCFAFYVGFSVSIAGATRVAQHIGAGFLGSARMASRISFMGACIAGIMNFTIIMSLRGPLADAFTADENVRHLISNLLPMVAILAILDPIVAFLTGILRAIGRPALGTSVQIPVYYAFAIPLALVFAFRLHWGLGGQWAGLLIGQAVLILLEGGLLWYMLDWEKAANDAFKRSNSD